MRKAWCVPDLGGESRARAVLDSLPLIFFDQCRGIGFGRESRKLASPFRFPMALKPSKARFPFPDGTRRCPEQSGIPKSGTTSWSMHQKKRDTWAESSSPWSPPQLHTDSTMHGPPSCEPANSWQSAPGSTKLGNGVSVSNRANFSDQPQAAEILSRGPSNKSLNSRHTASGAQQLCTYPTGTSADGSFVIAKP